jgi:amino acid transporter
VSTTTQDHSGGLARRSVTPIEVAAQSVANIAPSAVIAFTPAFMAIYAGNGAWFSFFIGMGIIMLVAYCVAVIARRRAGAGSLAVLARPSLGATGSFLTGWALFIGVGAIASGSLAGAGFFASQVFTNLKFEGFNGTGGQIFLDAVLLAAAILVTITSVRLAARVSATLELISIAVIVLVLLIVLFSSGNVFDSAQLKLSGATLDGMVFAVVLAILGFVGFESAAALGEESQDPFRAIPRAIRGSAILAGLLYMFATYSQVAAFEGGAAGLAASASPMDDLAVQYGLDGFLPILNLGITASFFAVVVACITVGGRLLFSWGNEGILPAWFGKVHPRHRTPARAISTLILPVFIPVVICLMAGLAPLTVTTYIDTVGVFGYMVSYILICFAAPLFLKKTNASGVPMAWVIGLLGAAALVYVFYRNIWPIPPSPVNTLPYYFIVLMILGGGGFLAFKARHPEAAARAGTFADDAPAEV